MLESLITSRTRLRLLVKFFSNSHASSHLRGLAKEMNESTNAVRFELNKLSKAGYLESFAQGKTIQYKANLHHPLFPELNSLVLKYLGLDKLIENIILRLGDVHYAIITGDYADGKDSGTIVIMLVGEIDKILLKQLIKKTELIIDRKVNACTMHDDEFDSWRHLPGNDHSIVLWSAQTVE